ncbi:sulfatase-like hydrolase/transferase [Opitutaceae bacterium]|nr:sulfatase-like hydrolase/transferase [Opitutaceae bacterium]
MKTLLRFACLTVFAAVAAADQPNVIVIVADDIGYGDVGFHDVVADGVVTPHLDRLAASGAVFEEAYAASPICSNSRLSLVTGRYAQRWGAYYYGDGGLPSDETTIAEMMKEAGYRTMKVGKTHLNGGPKEDPMKHGFDRYLGFTHHSWDFQLISQKDVDAYERKQPGSIAKARMIGIGPLTRDHGEKESFENTTTTEVFGRESVNFITTKSEQPFYLQLEFNAVHTPLYRLPKHLAAKHGVPERPFDRDAEVWEYPLWDPIAEPDYRKWYSDTCHLVRTDPYGRKIYLAHLELMDEMIGQIMAAVKSKGVAENTIIIFTSDNGGSDQSYANNRNINAFKYCLMDGGIKVPFVVSWPERITAGTRVDELVTHRDVYASLSEMTGIAPKKPLDGKNLGPLLRGEIDQLHANEMIFWDAGREQNWVAREGDWKLVFRAESKTYQAYELGEDGLVKDVLREVPIPSGLQLYNLGEDPGETMDMAERYPERVAVMKAGYQAWRAEMSDRIRGKDQK